MYLGILLRCWVHPKCCVMLRPWPVAVSSALSSLWNKLNRKATWDQSLIDVARNNHGICWADRSPFGVNGFFVIMPRYLAVIQTLNKCRSAGKIPGAAFFAGEIPAGRVLRCAGQAAGEPVSLSVTAFCTRAAGNVLPLHTVRFCKI